MKPLTITSVVGPGAGAHAATLTLPFERRQRSRQRAVLDDGREAALQLARGTVLRSRDRLRAECGTIVEVVAGPEPVSVARTLDPAALARAAYHLGNRHVPLQVLAGELRYGHDHVLDEMVVRLGLGVGYAELPFEPESGAYAGGGRHHHHHHHDH